MPLVSYLVLSTILFCIGLYGVLTRKNAVAILLCIEIMLNSANLNLIAFHDTGLIMQQADMFLYYL